MSKISSTTLYFQVHAMWNNLIDIKKIDVSKCKHNILFKIVSMQMNTSVFILYKLSILKKYIRRLECREEEWRIYLCRPSFKSCVLFWGNDFLRYLISDALWASQWWWMSLPLDEDPTSNVLSKKKKKEASL